jgi:D-xylose transport system substrate-binding protein
LRPVSAPSNIGAKRQRTAIVRGGTAIIGSIRRLAAAAALAAAFAIVLGAQAKAAELTVGVSWSNFQEERWKTDEEAIKSALAAAGAAYISADAQSSPAKQLTDIENLIARGAKALILLAQNSGAIGPAVAAALNEGIPVIGYDRLIENDGAYYLTFDNREVGRLEAEYVQKLRPKGNYVLIKGAATDPNAEFLHQGQLDILGKAIASGDIKIVGEQYTEGWKPDIAQRNMEQILTRSDNKVDAVVASNDGTAGGAIAALTAQGLAGIPVSGQDGDRAALNRIALGTQTVSVWKDARQLGKAAAEIALALARGTSMEKIPDSVKWTSPGGVVMNARFLTPLAITKDNLELVVEAGWISKAELCQGVPKGKLAICD